MSRVNKIDSILLREISVIISQEINDPKLGFPTVTEVDVSPDLNSAKVYVSFLGKNYKKRDGLDALRRSKGYIKSELAKRVRMRKIPDLTFVVDDTLDKADRIEEILHKDTEL
ncbi:MAG: 30S ribosome-binding factor RbfA [Erysipelotrichaceae bacterium]|nr:30S ribosome-binding factor RbfA [Erysipelotrichaceae bacterium]